MPLPRWLARLNRFLTNPLLRPAANWLPGFGVIQHRGRVSGRTYRTPVNVFRHPDAYVVALTYGPASQWVRNVLASGGCQVLHRGRATELASPRLVHQLQRPGDIPLPIRSILRLLDVDSFLYLSPVGPKG